jgi:diketogulonate reductase-like aldo/keto reductase
MAAASSAGTRSDTTCIMGISNSNNNSNSHPNPSEFPIGLGTMDIQPDSTLTAIESALSLGYKRIDCAPVYFNEDKIGDALSEVLSKYHQLEKEMKKKEYDGDIGGNIIRRKDLFVVSKLASPFHRKEHVKIGLQKTLNDLRLDYLDLYLIHWPQAFTYVDIDPNIRGYDGEAGKIDDSNNGENIDPNVSIHETWSAMEELVDEGLVRNIGVSNFPVSLLHELMSGNHRIQPVVNQVEMHPYLQQSKLLAYCRKRNVHVQAYSPLGSPGYKEDDDPTLLDDPVLKNIAMNHGITVAQVCIGWALQRGTTVVVKSTSPERQRENLKLQTTTNNIVSIDDDSVDEKSSTVGFMLSEKELREIAGLERGYRFFRPEEWWGDMAMAVFD